MLGGRVRRDDAEASKADTKTPGVGGRAPGPREGHFGLLHIRQRVAVLGGRIGIQSTPGAGIRMVIVLGCSESPAAAKPRV